MTLQENRQGSGQGNRPGRVTPSSIEQTKTGGHLLRFDHPNGRLLQFAGLIMRAAEAKGNGVAERMRGKNFYAGPSQKGGDTGDSNLNLHPDREQK